MEYSKSTKEIAKEMLGDKLKDPMLVWEAISIDGVKFPHQGCSLSDYQRKQNHAHELNIIDDIRTAVLAKDDAALGKLMREQIEYHLIACSLFDADMVADREYHYDN